MSLQNGPQGFLKAEALIQTIQTKQVQHLTKAISQKVIYMIWYDPWMAAGKDTFIHDMLLAAGFSNCITTDRYPILDEASLTNLNPDIILLSSEPFPFKEKHINILQELLPNTIIKCVDGELFSWYGSRMSKSFEYFRALNEELA